MRVLVTMFFVLLVAGCCKVYCDGRDLGISFRKFKTVETDTVVFESYLPKTNTKVDSFAFAATVPPTDSTQSTFSYPVSSAYDWKITLPSINKEFVIENFKLTKDQCSCSGREYHLISSFTVNGVKKNGLSLELE
ncbi:MAG: hypothetical protein EOO10_06000 [Chitinophagaceae bacterium]|nr:MAG: hypothetical protein EOO10_06000 [Chitinophagaceae bacterium]